VWNISYEKVACLNNWVGHSDPAALGSVTELGDGACCPGEVTVGLCSMVFSVGVLTKC
jgi:hypothetical protein